MNSRSFITVSFFSPPIFSANQTKHKQKSSLKYLDYGSLVELRERRERRFVWTLPPHTNFSNIPNKESRNAFNVPESR
jgi:hypothetical protein